MTPTGTHQNAASASGAERRHGELPVPSSIVRANAFLELRSRGVLWLICAFALAVLGTIDVMTGPEFAFSIFYLLPVAIAAWHLGWRAAVAVVTLSGLTWLLADRLAGNIYGIQFVQYWNALMRAAFFFLFAFMLTLLKQALHHERELARTDGLTGLPNRRSFEELAGREIARARRHARPMTVAFIDIDDFKVVNDAMGHDGGDELLRRVAAAARGALRNEDLIARLGGDEFAILLPDTPSAVASTVIERVLAALNSAATSGAWPVGFSIGAISFTDPPANVRTLLHDADQLMYEVKRDGGHAARLLTA